MILLGIFRPLFWASLTSKNMNEIKYEQKFKNLSFLLFSAGKIGSRETRRKVSFVQKICNSSVVCKKIIGNLT